MKALAECVRVDHAHLTKRIERLLVNEDEIGDLHYKVLPTSKRGDRRAYCALIRGEDQPKAPESAIPRAYRFFLEGLRSRLSDGLSPERFLRAVIMAFQVVLVTLDPRENPYRIFESLNAKGKPLTQGDLVRNYIAMMLPASRQEKVFQTSWASVEELLAESRSVGRLTELTAFLRHYLAMETGILCEEDYVYARFRDRSEREFPEASAFETELARMAKFAQHYDALLRPTSFANHELGERIRRLNELEAGPTYPLLLKILALLADGHLPSEEGLTALDVLENFFARRFLTGESASSLPRLFSELCRSLDVTVLTSALIARLTANGYPSDARVLRVLATRKLYGGRFTRRTALILESLNRRLSEGSGGFTVLDGAPTIEHVMPQSLSEEWKAALGKQTEQVHRNYLHTLGNLTLVTGEWNSELSNAPFEKKRTKLGTNALRLNSTYFTDDLTRWSGEEILGRTEALAEVALEIWPSLVPNSTEDKIKTQIEFHLLALERVANRLKTSLRKVSRARFESEDGKLRAVCLCSRQYDKEGPDAEYWYGFKTSQREFLEWQGVDQAGSSWVALECATPEKILLIPFDLFSSWLQHLNMSERGHWHVYLSGSLGRYWIKLSKQGARQEVTEHLLVSAPAT